MQNFKAEPLPYDMGNAGDLIKHGLIAEYTQWWCSHYGEMAFIDVFGGRPWQEPVNPRVSERVLKLKHTALRSAQKHPDTRYYGSGFVSKHAAEEAGCSSEVWVSDRDELALGDLMAVGFKPFREKAFDKKNAFTLLKCELDDVTASLILLDPFADFITTADQVFPDVADFIDRTNIPLAIYLLSDETTTQQYLRLRKEHWQGRFQQLSLFCPPLLHTQVKGESSYSSEIIVLLPENRFSDTIEHLKDRLSNLSSDLSEVLETTIVFNSTPPMVS